MYSVMGLPVLSTSINREATTATDTGGFLISGSNRFTASSSVTRISDSIFSIARLSSSAS